MQVGPRPKLPIELLRKLEIAFSHNNLERAQTIIEEAYHEFKPKAIDWSSYVADLFPPRQASILNEAGVIQLKDFCGTNKASLLARYQLGAKLLSQIIRHLHAIVREHRLMIPTNCYGTGSCDLFRDFERAVDEE
jgi:hypothetical protein